MSGRFVEPGSARFPDGFLWGAATAAHQVEGDNRNSDWWAWEQRPGTPVTEPSGAAIEHYGRFADDVAMLADLGLTAYRFSVEWARVEPVEGRFDGDALRHYREVTEAVRGAGMTPVVTLNHFTLPAWLALRGGWMYPDAPTLFARYCARVVTALDDLVDWYCTINEPGAVALGYVGALGFPPGTTDLGSWNAAITGLKRAHTRGLAAVKQARAEARAGATHPLIEYEANDGGRPIMQYLRHQMEDTFLEACGDDDFVGVQTYTRAVVNAPALIAPVTRALVGTRLLRRLVMPPLIRRGSAHRERPSADGIRRTDMGYEYRPQAVAATVRRVAGLLPGKDIVVTEHGIATADDRARVAFISEGLAALHGAITDGIPVRGYIHWSAFDNFEWALGYRMRFGIVAVDRDTQQRRIKPSGRLLGRIARTNALGDSPERPPR